MFNKIFTIITGLFMAFGASSVAQAQSTNIAVFDPTIAIFETTAFQTGYRQISEQYKSYSEQIKTKTQDQQGVLARLDTNGDKNVDDAELRAAQQANSADFQTYQKLQGELSQLELPIVTAQLYVLEQVSKQVNSTVDATMKERDVSVILSPDQILFAREPVYINRAVIEKVNSSFPAANISPPADWKPTNDVVQLRQRIGQLIQTAQYVAQQRQRAAQQQAGQEQPTGR